jgi:hypothetical protein
MLRALSGDLERHSAATSELTSSIHRVHMIVGKVLAALQRRRPGPADGEAAQQQFKLRRALVPKRSAVLGEKGIP